MKNNLIDIKIVPNLCGVYIFKNDKDVLYVGKAKNLKKRIQQYMNGSMNSYKTPILIERANNIEFIVCSNEKESLLLEQELIKKYKPYYNILLLDDKKYPYILVELKTNKLEIKTSFIYRNKPNSFYYGPLPPNFGYKTIKNFLIRECLYLNGLPIKSSDHQLWKEKFNYAKKILSSSNSEIIQKIKNQMLEASNNEQYELAKDFRDILQSLTIKEENQSIKFENNNNFEIIVFKQFDNYLIALIHYFKNGSFFMQEDFVLEIKINFYETITSFINSFYYLRNFSNLLVTNFEINKNDLIFNGDILYPKKGKYLQAINNALKNIEIIKDKTILEYKNKIDVIEKVKNYLFKILNRQINDFLMIDNSNESNKDIVSVIIYYKNFVPHYTNYRKYQIKKNINRKSDVEYINKGLDKYFSNNEEKPDLLIVDGGKQQINEAKKVLKKFELNIPILGLVKNNNHQTNYIIDENNNKHRIDNEKVFNYLSKIQIEVDKFAKSYHQKVKINSSLEGFLTSIEGIGPKTEKKLIDYFGTYSNIYNASYDKLCEVVSSSIAKKIIKNLENKV